MLTAITREYLDAPLPAPSSPDHLIEQHPEWCKCQRVCGGDQ